MLINILLTTHDYLDEMVKEKNSIFYHDHIGFIFSINDFFFQIRAFLHYAEITKVLKYHRNLNGNYYLNFFINVMDILLSFFEFYSYQNYCPSQ